MKTSSPIWRKVVSHEDWMNPGYEKSRHTGGRRVFLLEGCGHEIAKKISAGYREKLRCSKCEDFRAGTLQTSFDTDARIATDERWDPATALPVRTSRPMTAEEISEWVR